MIRKNFFSAFLILSLFAGLNLNLFAQGNSKSGTTAANFLQIGAGAAALGMGGAFVGVANDASSLYWNVSGIANSEKNNFIISTTNWIAGTHYNFAGLTIPLESFGTVGLSFTSLSMSDMKVRTIEMPEGTGEYFSSGDIAVGLSYARKLTDRFSIGFTAKYVEESIWHMHARGFAVDAGTLFRTDLFGGLTIGTSINNFGTTLQMSGRDSRDFIRIDPNKLGSNDRIPVNISMDSWEMPLFIQIGIATTPIKTENFDVTLAVDAVHPNNDYQSLNVGGEFSYRDFLFFRAGYRDLFLKDGEGGFSCGFGINTAPVLSGILLQIGYAYRNFGRLEYVHTFSFNFEF